MSAEGARIKVKVQPRSSRDRVVVVGALELRVYVTAPPEGGKANEAAVALLAKRLKVAKGSISVLRGHRSRDKVVQVQGLDDPSVMARLGSTGSGRGSPE